MITGLPADNRRDHYHPEQELSPSELSELESGNARNLPFSFEL
jgi:hypothetical protein